MWSYDLFFYFFYVCMYVKGISYSHQGCILFDQTQGENSNILKKNFSIFLV